MLQPISKDEDDLLLPYLRASNIQPFGIDISDVNDMWINPKEIGDLRLKDGDLLVSEGGDVGRSAIWKGELPEVYFQNSINRVRPLKRNCNSYLMFLLKTIKDFRAIDVICNKLFIAHLTAEKLNEISILIPPSLEQNLIANFLDRETRRIDALIEEKNRFTELLKEKRLALISHAVTKGLDPTVKMKDSEVDWLGEVPEHWKTNKLLHLTTRIGDGLHGTPNYVDSSEVFFINGNNLGNGFIGITDATKRISQDEYEKNLLPLDNATLLMSINGTIGSLAFYRGEAVMLGKSAAYINCSNKIHRKFLFFFLQSLSAKTYFDLVITGTTIFNLSLESIRSMPVTILAPEEQQKITDYLEIQTAKIDNLIQETQTSIELLKEHRTALISAAVTGKIDVREFAN